MDNHESPMEGQQIAGQTLSWMHSPEQPQRPQQPKVHPLIRQAVLELATRYRPNRPEELEPFQARIALLTKDVAHVNPQALKEAADEWARRERWLPKASELIDLIRETRGPGGNEVDLAAKYNARLAVEGKRGMKWIYDRGGQLKLISVEPHRAPSRDLIPPRESNRHPGHAD